ncbi:putative disease resistance protein [Quercus suber]|uniref:Disease resistance protein n=1 Tax=Quercus suber TaxID=58331 RepID=A0AAW0L8I2_QUESU
MEKSRSNVRSLQDRPIEKQPSDVYKPSVSVATIEAEINGLLERENPGLMLVTRGQIESIKLFVELVVAFLKDFEGLILESETEKAWVIEAEKIIGELHRDITTTTTANQMIWPLDLGSPAPIKNIDRLSDLFERKIVYGFTFIRRGRTKFLHQPPQGPQQRTLPSQISDDFIGILSFVDKIQNFLITIEEQTMETATNNLKNLSDLFVKVYGHFRYAKAIGGMKNSRRAWTDQMKIIVRDAETSLETYIESSASEISNSQNNTESWLTFFAEIDKLVQALSLLEMKIRVCRTELREDTNFVVGLEEDIHEVVSRLTNLEHQSSIVSIVGMKGIGKTTLAKIICEHTAIREHFNFFLWVALTNKVAGENVLKIIGEQVPRTDNERSGKEYLIRKAREFLRRDKYLVVLDNISTNKAWDDLKEAIPGTTNGSRILLTTRYKSVAVHADQSSVPHQLRLKTKEQSWRLFTQMVRFQPELSGPELSPKVKALANKVVGRCGGLPLSILRVGYLLSGKEVTADELLRVLEHIDHNQAPWLETLETIEKDLPLHLRQCLSYLSLFPRDFEIPAGRLTALWVAEGFANTQSVADNYFEELISLDLVQVLARKVNRTVKTCCFPSALRELWLRLNSKITSTASLSSRLDGRLAYYFDESDGGCSQSQGRSTNSPNVKSYRNSNSILFFDTREGYKPGEDIGNFLRKGIASGHLLQLQVLDLEHVSGPKVDLPRDHPIVNW